MSLGPGFLKLQSMGGGGPFEGATVSHARPEPVGRVEPLRVPTKGSRMGRPQASFIRNFYSLQGQERRRFPSRNNPRRRERPG